MTLWRIIAGGAALALLMLPGGPGFSFAAGSSFEAALEAVAACDQDAKPANLDFLASSSFRKSTAIGG